MNQVCLAIGDTVPLSGRMGSTMRDALIIVGAILLVGIGLLFWASAFRKRHRRRSAPHRPHYSHHSNHRSESEGGDEARHSSHSRRRRRRREHRPRNPTLAETGGLPPIRADGPARPPQPPPHT